jgi:MYXO-CTERM domain-containing protein
MKIKNILAAFVLLGMTLPRLASAQNLVLDSGTPTSSAGPLVLSTSQFLAGEFTLGSEFTVTSLSAYLTQGVGQPGDHFIFDIYSNAGFIGGRSNQRTLDYTTTGTFTTNGWNTATANWTPSTPGNYWLALQVSSTTQTRGLDAPLETSATTGTVPALNFAYAGTNGQYSLNNNYPIGLQIIATPEPASWALGLVALGGLYVLRRRTARA